MGSRTRGETKPAGSYALPMLVAASSIGCSDPPVDPPTAVVRVDPSAICRGDDFSTDVILSGSESTSRLTLVPVPPDEGEPPLIFGWDLQGDDYEIFVGSLQMPELRVRVSGERPLHASLTVTSLDFGQSTSTQSLHITVPEWASCDGGCPNGTRCFEAASGARCIPDVSCEFNVDCEICMVCDNSARLCVPREGAL